MPRMEPPDSNRKCSLDWLAFNNYPESSLLSMESSFLLHVPFMERSLASFQKFWLESQYAERKSLVIEWWTTAATEGRRERFFRNVHRALQRVRRPVRLILLQLFRNMSARFCRLMTIWFRNCKICFSFEL